MSKTRWLLTLGVIGAGALLAAGLSEAKGWDPKYVEGLPDSAFASVETRADGKKLRHLPYRDSTGKIDVAHVRLSLRLWSHVKWENSANAQPALAQLKAMKVALCHEGKMRCAGISRPAKIKRAKADKPLKPRKARASSKSSAPAKPRS